VVVIVFATEKRSFRIKKKKISAHLDVVLDVGLEVEQDPRGLGGPLPPHVPRQNTCVVWWEAGP
jgi:hypothetical protein